MATFRLSRYSLPGILKSIDSERLVAFLDPYRSFFQSRGVTLPDRGSRCEPEYDSLVRAFMSPDENTPKELIDALYYVDGMSSTESLEALLEAARAARLRLDDAEDVTPADIAVQV